MTTTATAPPITYRVASTSGTTYAGPSRTDALAALASPATFPVVERGGIYSRGMSSSLMRDAQSQRRGGAA